MLNKKSSESTLSCAASNPIFQVLGVHNPFIHYSDIFHYSDVHYAGVSLYIFAILQNDWMPSQISRVMSTTGQDLLKEIQRLYHIRSLSYHAKLESHQLKQLLNYIQRTKSIEENYASIKCALQWKNCCSITSNHLVQTSYFHKSGKKH